MIVTAPIFVQHQTLVCVQKAGWEKAVMKVIFLILAKVIEKKVIIPTPFQNNSIVGCFGWA